MPRNVVTTSEETLTLVELSQVCGVAVEQLQVLVAEGVVTPVGAERREWQFAIDDVHRAQCALRLQRDLGVDLAGAALAVDLLDDLRRMRQRIHVLESLLFERR